jgi:glycine/sarcosine N-methyltransferase
MVGHDTDSTRFYDALAPLFDVMTDWESRLATEAPFLRRELESAGAHTVLDAACGSGGHAVVLAGWGYMVSAADASPVMIEMARAKAATVDREIPFAVASLAELPAVAPGPFDAVLCLGNSLPHLPTQQDLIAALGGMWAVLAPGGLLVLHNLNYDRRWKLQPRWFAAQGGVLDEQEVLVWRFADYHTEAQEIAFNVALFRKGAAGWQVEVHTTPHRPLFQADLLAALAEVGFGEVRSYGAMQAAPEPFDPSTSGDLVMTARKIVS